jgi:hypothetical protein
MPDGPTALHGTTGRDDSPGRAENRRQRGQFMTSTQIQTQQRCASHWNQAEQWKRSQKPDRSRRDQRPFNTVSAQLDAKRPNPRVRVLGLAVA